MLDRKVWALPAFPLPLIHIYIDKIVHSPLFFLSVFKCIFLKKKKKTGDQTQVLILHPPSPDPFLLGLMLFQTDFEVTV